MRQMHSGMKCKLHIPRIRVLGRLLVCWHLVTKHRSLGFIKTLQGACIFLLTGYWPKAGWLYANYMLLRVDQQRLVMESEEIFTFNVYGLDIQKSHPVIVDIGANVGNSVIYFLQKYPNSTIYAFEPHKPIFSYMIENLSHIDIKQESVYLYNCAVVHKETKKVPFYVANNILTSSWSTTTSNIIQKKHIANIINVSAMSFQSLLSKTGHIDLLKVDIEGGEYALIPDIIQFYKQIDSFIIEMHNFIDINKQGKLYSAL